ncbi:MAG: hypothetical protein U5K75_12045 [Ahrensia sp.]|nr:hypothetical protein [Ahrensia sp.]
MPLITRVQDLATRIATECKSLRTMINGNATDLSALNTTAKNNIVAALNELKAAVDAGASGAVIDDAATASSTTWSSTKISGEITAALNALTTGAPAALDTLAELAAAIADDANYAGTVTTALGNRVRVDASQSLTAPQQTQARDNIGAQEAALIGDPDTNFVTTFTTGLV